MKDNFTIKDAANIGLKLSLFFIPPIAIYHVLFHVVNWDYIWSLFP